MNKSAEYRVGIGASSILMIFIVLCLTTLGVLSFASARANLTLTQRRLEQVEAYYEGVAQAQTLLAQIDAALLAASEDADTYFEQVKALGDIDPRIRAVDAQKVTYTLPVGDAQSLQVELAIHAPGEAQRYTMTKHQLAYTGEWEPDTSIKLKTEEVPTGP